MTRPRGFTLTEMIMVIVITGVIAGVVAVFLQGPIQGYFDSVRRAALSDAADLALRRIDRDLRSALPNSIRTIDAGRRFVEFVAVRSGGRYCASTDCGDPLDTSSAGDRDFDVLGPGVAISAGDSIVIYNTGQTGADAYTGDNLRPFNGAAGAAVAHVAFGGSQFPRDSATYRFDVVSAPVLYACDAATGTLWRYSGYTLQASYNAATVGIADLDALPGVVKAALATNVVCAADATNLGTGFDVSNADGLISMRLQLRDASNETLSLYREVHVDNAP
jgi:MSHA biogenesis protein MshO